MSKNSMRKNEQQWKHRMRKGQPRDEQGVRSESRTKNQHNNNSRKSKRLKTIQIPNKRLLAAFDESISFFFVTTCCIQHAYACTCGWSSYISIILSFFLFLFCFPLLQQLVNEEEYTQYHLEYGLMLIVARQRHVRMVWQLQRVVCMLIGVCSTLEKVVKVAIGDTAWFGNILFGNTHVSHNRSNISYNLYGFQYMTR